VTDCILENVHHKIWEKDVVNNKKKPFITRWIYSQGTVQRPTKPDNRPDDKNLTPKGKEKDHPNITKFNFHTNPLTIVYQPTFEENEAPPPKLDTFCLESLQTNG